jgi:hypothetical protein
VVILELIHAPELRLPRGGRSAFISSKPIGSFVARYLVTQTNWAIARRESARDASFKRLPHQLDGRLHAYHGCNG